MRFICIAVVLAMGATSCAGTRTPGPYQPAGEAARNPERARELNGQAADLLEMDAEGAEALLREALTEDLYCGPAHNNLGVVLLERGDLYAAAEEFEWARKLMPGHPDPRLNLAITLDSAGRDEDAWANYEAVLAVRPGYVPAIQGLARLCSMGDTGDHRLVEWLGIVAVQGENEAWRDWARKAATRQRR